MRLAKTFITVFLSAYSLSSLAQAGDSAKAFQHFSGTASVTNNGISLVPSFSLGKPAALFLLSFGGERFSIDPDIRFGLDGKPWTFLFWARYKWLTEGRFRFTTGAHLGLNFRKGIFEIDGVPTENLVVRRYLAGELVPIYSISKNIHVGAYYLYSRRLDNGTVKNTHFVTLNASFSHVPITRHFYFRVTPQIFYLNQDGLEGYYATGLITLAKQDFPFSISYLINKKLRSSIPGKNLIESVSLTYSFNQRYIPRRR